MKLRKKRDWRSKKERPMLQVVVVYDGVESVNKIIELP
jgi:hypothetical protein